MTISHCSLELPERKRKVSLDEFRENKELFSIQEEFITFPSKTSQISLNHEIEPSESDLQSDKEVFKNE